MGAILDLPRNLWQLLRIIFAGVRFRLWGLMRCAPIANPDGWRDYQGKASDVGERLKAALIWLGPSYIKFGQVISTRVDLLGDDIADELTALQDGLEGFSFNEVERIIAQDFSQPIDALYADFAQEPVHAASVAQVHKATTLDGRSVAVKILRPGIERKFRADVRFLSWLATLAAWVQPRLKPKEIIETYKEQILFETDLRLEAGQADQYTQNTAGYSEVTVPRVDWARTSKHVMTMDWRTGTPIDDRAQLLADGHDLPVLMNRAASLFFKTLFNHGFFHGDQHAGNMFVTREGKVLFVDFGIMGRLSYEKRCFLADLMTCLFQRDYDKLADNFFAEGYLTNENHRYPFALAVRAAAEPILEQPLEKVSFARLLGQLLNIGQSFGLQAQPDLFLLQKNMLMAEGTSRQLTPELNIWSVAKPLVEEWVIANRGPIGLAAEDFVAGTEMLRKLPQTVQRIETAASDLSDQTRQQRLPIGPIAAGIVIGGVITYLLT